MKFKEKNHEIRSSVQDKELDAEWLRSICIKAGADDAGFVEITREEIASEKNDILSLLPATQSLIGIACKINRDSIRSPSRSLANTEFQQTSGHIMATSRKISSILNEEGIRAVNVSGLFPMEMDRWPGKIWDISLKPLAIAAGLGRMGEHRMIIHSKFGAFMYLSAILIDREVAEYSRPLDFNPCLDCKLCSATCPTGAIASDGHFDFFSCITHNYREKLGGFSDWTENVVESKNAFDYRKKVSDSETVSMWQSLATGGSTKCDQCMAVCPAGDDVLGHFIQDRKGYLTEVVKPLQKKEEKIYVIPGSDAENHVAKRFPHKTIRPIGNGLRPGSIMGFLGVLPRIFQRGQSEGLNSIYHFTFTGNEKVKATVTIKDKKIEVLQGHDGKPDLHVTADSMTWLKFLAKEKNIVWALMRRKVRMKGPIKLMLAFGKCFPS